MAVRITCINKDSGNHENPHTAISYMNWVDEQTGKIGRCSREVMYDFVKKEGNRSAYVRDYRGDVAYLEARLTPNLTKYVRTIPDNTRADNLLSLPECISK
jgi:hypothetical protein